MNPLAPVNRDSVVATVVDRIKEAIERGELRRGDRLPSEPELASQLNIGRTSVREALKMLQALGLLEVRAGQGTFISQAPRRPVVDPLHFLLLLEDGTHEDLVEFRYLFEVAFSKLAQRKITPQVIAELEEAIANLKRAMQSGTVTADCDLAFHQIILEATENPFVIQVGNTIFELLRASIDRVVRSVPEQAVADHERLLEALKSGDSLELERAIADSYRIWQTRGGSITHHMESEE